MTTVEKMLNEPEIKRFLEGNQNAANRIKGAAEHLAAQRGNTLVENSVALKKLLRSLADQVVNVFFSYKKKDERAAKAIVEVLRENAADKLKIAYQADFTTDIAGRQWRQKISDEVRKANWFILLLPDPSDELDWCLFETGLFQAQLTVADRLICLHHPDTAIPSPIEDYQAIAATLPEVEKFLNMVFIKPDAIFGLPPINSAIANQIPKFAERVVYAITAPKRRLYHVVFEPAIEIRLDNARVLKAMEDLDSATVVTANKEALALFGFIEPQKTFAELRKGIEEPRGDARWREELFQVIRKIANGRVFTPIQAVLRSQTGKTYHPVVHAIDKSGPEGPIEKYHITFAEDVATADTTAMPDKLATLVTLLRFTFRFRWEVLEPFSREPLSDDEVERLDISMARIQADWNSRGRIEPNAINELFTEKQNERIDAMNVAWSRLHNPERKGELDIAIKKKDGKAIPSLLATILPMNQEFLELAADRFAEMVTEEHKSRTTS